MADRIGMIGTQARFAARLRALLPEPVLLAWLLRDDVRHTLPDDDAEAAATSMLAWWVLFGRAEAGNTEALPVTARQLLWGTTPPPWAESPPVLRAALPGVPPEPALRQIVAQGGLDDTFPPDLLAWLDAPAAGYAPRITNRIVLAWEHDEAMFEAFDLACEDDAARYLASIPSPTPHQAPPPSISAPRQGLAVRLVGFARAEYGVGEDVRMAAAACEAAGIAFDLERLAPRTRVRNADASLDRLAPASGSPPVHLYFLSALDTAMRRLSVPPPPGPPPPGPPPWRIGVWPWELARVPPDWAPIFELVDEIWAASRFTRDAFAAATDKPVFYMPPAVHVPAPAAKGRADWGLPADCVLFGCVFDRNSFLDRKNPVACLEAFQAAFPRRAKAPKVALLIKVIGAEGHAGADPAEADWQALRDRFLADPRVHLREGTLDRPDLLALLGSCDALVSLHRAEGFGRVPAEAMLLGVPVIATDYSGSRDVLHRDTGFPVACRTVPVPPGAYPWSEGAVWAEPDLADAARQMRRIVADPATARARARLARARMHEEHAPAIIGARYRARLQHLLVAQPASARAPESGAPEC